MEEECHEYYYSTPVWYITTVLCLSVVMNSTKHWTVMLACYYVEDVLDLRGIGRRCYL